jgi:tRNA(Ile)-lysidine synthase
VSFHIHPDIERWLIDERDCQLIAAILMRKFFSLVEDQSRLALKDLARPAGFIFPSIIVGQRIPSSGINVGNVTLIKDPTTQDNIIRDQKKFLIHPRPVRAPEEFTQTLSEVIEDNGSTYEKPVWTETKLFHDRWWIKLRYIPADLPANTSVVVRFLRQGESTKEGGPWHERSGLSLLPSGKLRHTIPMIVQITEVKDQDGLVSKKERILAFPSIGLSHIDCQVYKGHRTYDSPWQYTCIYKDIDFDASENHTVKSYRRGGFNRLSLTN